MTLKVQEPASTILYPGSDFWPDAIPALLIKFRYPQTFLLATFYLTAPNPFRGFDEGGKWHFPRLNTIFYWMMQKPIYALYKAKADAIIVTSEPDVEKFPKQKSNSRVFVVRGGVDLEAIHRYRQRVQSSKYYDAIYMGRFHPQKGVVELVDIWQIVVKSLSEAKLTMIGDGTLMDEVKEKIKKNHLERNIILQGYILQPEKRYALFSQSKIVVHPAIYDSGGMSAAEAMAFGLPAISFDLEALKTYYPHGMLKVPLGDKEEFAQGIVDLLTDKKLYDTTSREAKDDIVQYWSWSNRAEEFLHFLRSSYVI
jgi:glycosyltransferase involved in cell wall biosynthesis